MEQRSPKPTSNGPLKDAPSSDKPQQVGRRGPSVWILLLLALSIGLLITRIFAPEPLSITYSFFDKQVREGNVQRIEVRGQTVFGKFKVPPLESELQAHQAAKDATATPPPATQTAPDPQSPPVEEDKPKETSGEAAPESPSTVPVPSEGAAAEASAEEKRLAEDFTVVLLAPYVEMELGRYWLDNGVQEVVANPPADYSTLFTILWLAFIVLFTLGMMWFFTRQARDQMMGGGMLGNIIRSPARRYEKEDQPITFNDVAGLEGVKRDLKEVVDFLKDPVKFQRLGARVPKGVLLMGPPGTGKTLLAKAVAGEAGVPFFSVSGSEFIQMFVGVGASRVRDLFKTAKEHSPSIMFIDEIDAVGRERGAGLGGGHDEREQTLNQILSEMDGFTPTTSVIVMAATNRPDVLDPALLRPGRFDRHITVDRPSVDARRQLFEVHTRNMPIAEDVDFDRLARATVGLTGADIRNLANEAALWATRHNKSIINESDFEYARDKVLMGGKRDDVLTEPEKRITAFHEAGHTLLAWYLAGSDRVHKVTIIPRGRALGVTQIVPEEDRHNLGQHDMNARLAMLLAGRTAEKLKFDEYSAGAENDLKEATRLARRMVTHWGMSPRLGPVAYHTSEDHPFLGREIVQDHRPFSEHTAQIIDEEVAKILHVAADRARQILTERRQELERLSEALLDREELDEREIEALIGPPLYRSARQGGSVVADPPSSPVAPSPTNHDGH